MAANVTNLTTYMDRHIFAEHTYIIMAELNKNGFRLFDVECVDVDKFVVYDLYEGSEKRFLWHEPFPVPTATVLDWCKQLKAERQ